jgi:hypothetical protein
VTLAPQELDDLYTDLCYRMARAGEAVTPQILARLTLLLMHEVGDVARVRAAIVDATRDFPETVTVESPF